MKQNVLIIGAGEIGTAISKLLAGIDDTEIALYDVDEELCSSDEDLLTLLRRADFVFICVPSGAIGDCLPGLKKHLKPKTIIISLTKGICPKSKKFTGELLIENFGEERVAVLGGPMLSEEIIQGFPTRAAIGSTKETFEKVAGLFNDTKLTLEHSEDILGISIAGVLKNVYAIGLSIADALNLGADAKGVLNKLAISEMGRLVELLGGRLETALGLAGVGDLVATANSPYSKNRELGRRIAKGEFDSMRSEGSDSLPLLIQRLSNKDIPEFLRTIESIVSDKTDAKSAIEKLLS